MRVLNNGKLNTFTGQEKRSQCANHAVRIYIYRERFPERRTGLHFAHVQY